MKAQSFPDYTMPTDQHVPVAHVLPLELALVRWSVVHRKWHEMANDMPLIQAFLAGWFCRCIGASQPAEVGVFRESFRAGWREADEQIVIAARLAPVTPACDGGAPTAKVGPP